MSGFRLGGGIAQPSSREAWDSTKAGSARIRVENRLVLAVIFGALALRVASEQTALLSYGVLAFLAMFGRRHAITALAVSWLITMVNPGLAPEAYLGAAGRYFVILAAAVSVLWRSSFFRAVRVQPIILGTLALGAFFIVHSWFVSPFLDVSILKALSWTIVVMTLLSAWSGLSPERRRQLSEQLYAAFVALALLSLPLLFLPVGFLRNGTGFQGILNHPQAFGTAMALLGAWTVGRFLGTSRPPWRAVLLSVLCLVLSVLSETRTAGLGLVFGVVTAVLVVPLIAGRKIVAVLPGLQSRRFQIVAAFGLVGLIVAAPLLHAVVDDFISKSGREEVSGVLEAYDRSRGVLIDPVLENIQTTPLRGIGFGIASQPEFMEIQRDPVLGLPIGASIEKGVMPLAILEEVGIPGAALFLVWLWMILRRSAKAGMAPFTVVITILFINLGESVFFSPGGMGMLQLILVAWAASMGFGKKITGRLAT